MARRGEAWRGVAHRSAAWRGIAWDGVAAVCVVEDLLDLRKLLPKVVMRLLNTHLIRP